MNFSKIIKFAIFSKFLKYFLSFFEVNHHYWPTKVSEMSYLTELSRQKIVFIFLCGVQNIFFVNFDFFSFFLYDIFIHKVRKLDVGVSNPIIFLSPILSFGWGSVPSLSGSRFISLSLFLSLSLLISHFSCCYVA